MSWSEEESLSGGLFPMAMRVPNNPATRVPHSSSGGLLTLAPRSAPVHGLAKV